MLTMVSRVVSRIVGGRTRIACFCIARARPSRWGRTTTTSAAAMMMMMMITVAVTPGTTRATGDNGSRGCTRIDKGSSVVISGGIADRYHLRWNDGTSSTAICWSKSST